MIPLREPTPEIAPPLPATDLFLGLAAILMIALTFVSAYLSNLTDAARDAIRAPATAETTNIAAATLAASEERVVILVRAEGIHVSGPQGALGDVPRDALPETTALAAWLRIGDGLVIIGPEAGDTTFLLETALARNGADSLGRIRLSGECASLVAHPAGYLCAPR